MKRIRIFTLLLALCLALTGCGAAEIASDEPGCKAVEPGAPVAAGLLQTASPETSALILYYYDGETVTSRTLYDGERERELIERINALPAREVEEIDLSQWSLPCYGLWISAQDGTDLYAAWSEGLWLGGDGSAWQVEADFAGYWQTLEGEEEDSALSVLSFPCAGLLAPCDGRFLAPSEEDYAIANLPLRTYLTVQDITGGIATVVIDNQSGYEMSYSEYYSLQVERDGEWYTLPPREPLAFNDIAYLLPDLEQAAVTCDLTPYGDLEAGHYRLVKDDMAAEFWLDEAGELTDDNLCGYPPADGVTVTAVQTAPDTLTVTLENRSDADTDYGWAYSLWQERDGVWEQIEPSELFGVCGVKDPLPAGETVTLHLPLAPYYEGLEPGDYRLSLDMDGRWAEFCLTETVREAAEETES